MPINSSGGIMLNSILPYVIRYTNVIATVTGIDIEVADANLVRVAGTGMYAEGVGQSIRNAGQTYRHVLASRETVFMDNPREHPLCQGCANLLRCRETLSLCTPIVFSDKVLGVIGLVCFDQTERERVLAQQHVFIDFVRQMADAISKAVQEEENVSQTRKWLDMLLQVVDNSNRGILVLDSKNCISYCNEIAIEQLKLPADRPMRSITLNRTGDMLSGMEEFAVNVDGRASILLGQLLPLDSKDPAFSQVLVFDSLPRLTELLSQSTPPGEETGGLNAIVGKSRAVMKLKAKVLQLARTPSTVLITGESGTGKEMFARAIHAESDRRDKPFIAINCGAIPDALLESELFGYVRGAFTGASPSGRMGKFELAHQGVLFLDEIGAMPLYLQVKLLRVLQERCIIRLGSNRLIDVDVRIIAATNDNLQELINQRMFRDDLYYRLNVIPLEIPPLRDRRDDIPALGAYFLERYCRLFSKRAPRLPAAVTEALQAYSWPGNVREFENIIEYLVNVMPDGGPLLVPMLPAKIRAAASGHVVAETRVVPAPATTGPYPVVPLRDLEAQAIWNALDHFGDSAEGKRQAAAALDIGIATLYRKLKQTS